MSDCEWNPTAKRPAFDTDPSHAEATQSVGVDGKWHLCDGCAALPEFARYRNRRPLTRRRPPRVKRRANRQAAIMRAEELYDNLAVSGSEPCRVCGGSGFVAHKQFIDDGYGEVDSCPACDDNQP